MDKISIHCLFRPWDVERTEGELKNPRFCPKLYEASAARHGSGVALDEGERELEVVR